MNPLVLKIIYPVAVHLQHQLAKGTGGRIELQQAAQPMVAVHHPEGTAAVAHQGHGLALQVLEPLLKRIGAEVALAAA